MTNPDDFSASGLEQLRRSLDDAGAVEVVDALVGELDEVRTGLTQALAQGDLKSLRLRIHTLKGVCGMLQSETLRQQSIEIEKMLANERFDEAAPEVLLLLSRYEAMVRRARESLPQ